MKLTKEIIKFIIKNNYKVPKNPQVAIFNKWVAEKANKYPEVKKWAKNQKINIKKK